MKKLLISLLISVPLYSFSDVVVDFNSSTQDGGNIDDPPVIQSGVELGGGSSADSQSRITLAQNLSSAWSATAADYNGPEYYLVWDGIEFNGGAQWDTNDSNPISIRFQTTGGSGTQQGNFHLAVIFPTVSTYTFDATSSLTLDLQRQENTGDVRWLIRSNGIYYLSQTTISGDTTFDQASGLLTENWAVYDIAASADFDQGSAVYSTPTSSLTSIDGFGIMADKDNMSASRHWLGVSGFQADAVIPEPGTLMLVGMSMVVLIGVRRIR